MATRTLEQKLQRLRDEVLVLGEMVVKTLGQSVEYLQWPDFGNTRRGYVFDLQVARKRFAIESDCLVLAAAYPLANDNLWVIISALEIAIELENIEQRARDIAKTPLMPTTGFSLKGLFPLRRMALQTQHELQCALEAYERGELAWAQIDAVENDGVGALRQLVGQELQPVFKNGSAPMAERARSLWQVSYHLERIADRINSIRGWADFAVTGTMTKWAVEMTEEGSE
ncbi:MAG: phosphate uptake regulator PhoU [Anaerolineae bacterium]